MGLKTYHDISGIYCDNDINDDNSEKLCICMAEVIPKTLVILLRTLKVSSNH